MRQPLRLLLVLAGLATAVAVVPAQQPEPAIVFKGGVDLVRLTATVTDRSGSFVQGLRKDDFAIFEDGVRQEITQFSSERAPVSLGILLDVSGSMTTEKMAAAREAIDRFIFDLLGQDDELFFIEFAGAPVLSQDWTTDRRLLSRAVREARASGNTALYDAVAMAVPKAETGSNRKKALLVISDGNDSHSTTTISQLQQAIRESEVIVYALGIDSVARDNDRPRWQQPQPRIPVPQPFPQPGRPRLPGIGAPPFRPQWTPPIAQTFPRSSAERVDSDTLRRITDETGGRSEIVRGSAGLAAATRRIADELSRQYDLGYASNREKDRQWHAIRIEVPDRRVTVRARTGYYAG